MPKKEESSDDKEEKKESGDETTEKENDATEESEKTEAGADKTKKELAREKKGILKDLQDTRKELKEIKNKQEEKEEEEMKEKEKFEELAEKKKKKLKKVGQRLETERKRNAFQAIASNAGVVSLNDAFVLANKDDIEVDDEGGVDENSVKKVVDQLKEEKPYLFEESSGKVGSPSSPKEESEEGKESFTREEIRDMGQEEYDENREEILKALKEGKVKEK